MKITIVGAAGGEVTGSAYYVQTKGAAVLVDCGLFQGGKKSQGLNRPPTGPKQRLDAVLLNDVSQGRGFGEQGNVLTPITPEGPGAPLGPLPKDRLAEAVVAWWAGRLGLLPLWGLGLVAVAWARQRRTG